MKKVSIIVPCYNEQESLPYFWQAISEVAEKLSQYTFEFIFVDDGSRDETLSVLRAMAAEDARIRYLSFSRNFGKEAAMFAGLEASRGDYVAIMDADLQDPPALIPEMLDTLEREPYDCVATRRVDRKGEPPIRSFFARQFYKLMHKISKTDIVDGARDFRLMKRKMVDSILSLKEYNRFSKGIFGWVGYRTKWLEYENVARAHGETKWSFWKLLFYSVDGIVAFSTVPLAISSILGIVFCFLSFAALIFVFVRQLIWPDSSAYGWPSAMCILFFISGIQLFFMGVLGQYLAKTYLEVKKRPIYIVGETEADLTDLPQTPSIPEDTVPSDAKAPSKSDG
ncbi:MAG: glycosyltransferase family 2 protein [Clostridia bacterium]|nr:glycosyltransferase family 2 protein [Clostridia bacterium]